MILLLGRVLMTPQVRVRRIVIHAACVSLSVGLYSILTRLDIYHVGASYAAGTQLVEVRVGMRVLPSIGRSSELAQILIEGLPAKGVLWILGGIGASV